MRTEQMADDIDAAGLRLSQIARSLGGSRGEEVAQVRDVLRAHRCAPAAEVATCACGHVKGEHIGYGDGGCSFLDGLGIAACACMSFAPAAPPAEGEADDRCRSCDAGIPDGHTCGPIARDSAPSILTISLADGDIVATLDQPDEDDDLLDYARAELDRLGAAPGWYGLATAYGPNNPDHIDYRPTDSSAVGGLLTLPPEPPEGTTVQIEGGNSDGQVWEHVHVGLTPDASVRWTRRVGVSSSDWSTWSGLWWRLTEDDGAGQVGIRVVPAPVKVGETVPGERARELRVGAVVLPTHVPDAPALTRLPSGWSGAGVCARGGDYLVLRLAGADTTEVQP